MSFETLTSFLQDVRTKLLPYYAISSFLTLASHIVILNVIYSSGQVDDIYKALQLLAVGQTLNFLDFGSNALMIQLSAAYHKFKNPRTLVQIYEIFWRTVVICMLLSVLIISLVVINTIAFLMGIYLLLLVWLSVLNLFLNILRSLGFYRLVTFSTSLPWIVAASIAWSLKGSQTNVQIWPLLAIALSFLYAFTATIFYLFNHNDLDPKLLNVGINRIKDSLKSIYKNGASLKLWIYNLSVSFLLNADRMPLISNYSPEQIVKLGPYFLLFVGLCNIILAMSLNHAVHIIQADDSTQSDFHLFKVGLLMALMYPLLVHLYVFNSNAFVEYRISVVALLTLSIIAFTAIVNLVTNETRESHYSFRAIILFAMALMHYIVSSHLVTYFDYVASPIAICVVSSITIIVLMILRELCPQLKKV